ncbi:flagellar biosynthetic protein FliO [Thorsellia anophelis]|uniref:Flagellar protein n=1 Tax=Thorsellia anophelis DSM 18579 TaxID=1123402 RepID=A0A1H9ZT73_9GAMM|nr:flagellar biosynthetic protein FliO [Thorsellia anophelis]SES84880.1 Flagellar biosynthesis protein, FliO [Thorsellia anophelis DSM 18579]
MALPKINIDAVNSSITKLPDVASTENTSSFTEAYVSLILVLAFIIFLAWILKKLGTNSRFRRSKNLDIIDSISVGSKERVFLLRQNKRLLTIGVTQHSISLLNSELIEDEELSNLNNPIDAKPDENSIPASFKDKLDSLLKR